MLLVRTLPEYREASYWCDRSECGDKTAVRLGEVHPRNHAPRVNAEYLCHLGLIQHGGAKRVRKLLE